MINNCQYIVYNTVYLQELLNFAGNWNNVILNKIAFILLMSALIYFHYFSVNIKASIYVHDPSSKALFKQ